METMGKDCLFCKIVNSDIPSEIVYSDDKILAFNDINPQAPVHVIFVPRKHVPTVNDLSGNDYFLVSHIFEKIKEFADKKDFSDLGYRVVVNCNKNGGQEVYHLHVHLLAGRDLRWPPG